MALMTKEFFLAAAPELKREEVEIPALGASLLVHELTAGEKDAFEAQHIKHGRTNFRARTLAWTVRDEGRNRIFTDADIPELARRSAAIIDPIVEVALRVNSLGPAEVADIEKN